MPLRPAVSEAQVSAAEFPQGVTAPTPVITTRRRDDLAELGMEIGMDELKRCQGRRKSLPAGAVDRTTVGLVRQNSARSWRRIECRIASLCAGSSTARAKSKAPTNELIR